MVVVSMVMILDKSENMVESLGKQIRLEFLP